MKVQDIVALMLGATIAFGILMVIIAIATWKGW